MVLRDNVQLLVFLFSDTDTVLILYNSWFFSFLILEECCCSVSRILDFIFEARGQIVGDEAPC